MLNIVNAFTLLEIYDYLGLEKKQLIQYIN
jgi:hypothetical protein